MNVSGIRAEMPLSIYGSIREPDDAKRGEFIEQLKRLSVEPIILGDNKVEFRYRGSRNTVMKLATYTEAHKVHSIQISSGAK